MDEDPTVEQIFAAAEREIAGGMSPADAKDMIDRIAGNLGLGVGPALGGLGEAFLLRIEARQEAEKAGATLRVAERGRMSAAVQTILNTLSFGQAGGMLDLAGKAGLEGVSGDEFRAGMADLRLAEPVRTGATELGAGLLVGGPALAAGKGLLARVGMGSVVGGTTSGLFGFGEAEGTLPERIEGGARSIAPGMAFGGTMGAFMRPAVRTVQVMNRARRGRRAANRRLGKELQETTGLSRDINPQLATAEAEVKRVQKEMFGPIDEAFKDGVVHNDVRSFLLDIADHPDAAGATAGRSLRGVRRGDDIPTPSDLREIRNNLWSNRNTRGLGDELQDIMNNVITGHEEASIAFRKAKDITDAFQLGTGTMSKTFNGVRIKVGSENELLQALADLPVESHEAFKTGLLQRTINRISRPETGAASDVKLLRSLIDDADVDGKLRALFPNDGLAEEFMAMVQNEVSARILRKALVRAGITAAQVAALGGAVALGASLLDN